MASARFRLAVWIVRRASTQVPGLISVVFSPVGLKVDVARAMATKERNAAPRNSPSSSRSASVKRDEAIEVLEAIATRSSSLGPVRLKVDAAVENWSS